MHDYNQRKQTNRGWGWLSARNAVLMASVAVMAILAALALGGCTTTRYVLVESVRTEYKDREVEKLITDTVRDTRFVFVKGDTVQEWREREHIRMVAVHDTCFIEHTDSIRVPYPVEKRLTAAGEDGCGRLRDGWMRHVGFHDNFPGD